jgi:hypothetical protein
MTIDVEKLAIEAGISTSTRMIWPPTFQRSYDFNKDQLERFVGLVLESAALEFNQPHMELFIDQIQDAIRAMKPGVKP